MLRLTADRQLANKAYPLSGSQGQEPHSRDVLPLFKSLSKRRGYLFYEVCCIQVTSLMDFVSKFKKKKRARRRYLETGEWPLLHGALRQFFPVPCLMESSHLHRADPDLHHDEAALLQLLDDQSKLHSGVTMIAVLQWVNLLYQYTKHSNILWCLSAH